MKPEDLIVRNFEKEFIFLTSRSSGPGGQNVNKVNTKVELRFSINESGLLSEEEKRIISGKLRSRITGEGILKIISQSSRSQAGNKKAAIEKFYSLVSAALTPKPRRIPTKPSTASKKVRLDEKKKHGILKRTRRASVDSDLL